MRKLTWNQWRALHNLSGHGVTGASPREISDPPWPPPYLCVSAARSACMSLVRDGLAQVSYAGSPMTYRITDAGRLALAEREGEG